MPGRRFQLTPSVHSLLLCRCCGICTSPQQSVVTIDHLLPSIARSPGPAVLQQRGKYMRLKTSAALGLMMVGTLVVAACSSSSTPASSASSSAAAPAPASAAASGGAASGGAAS